MIKTEHSTVEQHMAMKLAVLAVLSVDKIRYGNGVSITDFLDMLERYNENRDCNFPSPLTTRHVMEAIRGLITDGGQNIQYVNGRFIVLSAKQYHFQCALECAEMTDLLATVALNAVNVINVQNEVQGH